MGMSNKLTAVSLFACAANNPEFFPSILESIASGEKTLKAICDENGWAYGAFRWWIHADADREREFEEAQKISADAYVEDGLRIVDGVEDKEAVPAARLKTDYRRFLASIYNRDRYSEKATGLTVNLGANSLVNILSNMPSSAQEVLSKVPEKVIEQQAGET